MGCLLTEINLLHLAFPFRVAFFLNLNSPFEFFNFLIAALWKARSSSDPKSLGENPSVFFTSELKWAHKIYQH